MKRNFNDYSEPVEGAVTEQHSWKCNAMACELPGGLTTGGGAGAKYYCRFHYGRDWKHSKMISDLLRPYVGIFSLIPSCNDYQKAKALSDLAVKLGNDDLVLTTEQGRDPDLYAVRVLKSLTGRLNSEIDKRVYQNG